MFFSLNKKDRRKGKKEADKNRKHCNFYLFFSEELLCTWRKVNNQRTLKKKKKKKKIRNPFEANNISMIVVIEGLEQESNLWFKFCLK